MPLSRPILSDTSCNPNRQKPYTNCAHNTHTGRLATSRKQPLRTRLRTSFDDHLLAAVQWMAWKKSEENWNESNVAIFDLCLLTCEASQGDCVGSTQNYS